MNLRYLKNDHDLAVQDSVKRISFMEPRDSDSTQTTDLQANRLHRCTGRLILSHCPLSGFQLYFLCPLGQARLSCALAFICQRCGL